MSAISNFLRKFGYSRKKVNKKKYSNLSKLTEERINFISKMKDISENDVICIDESYFMSNEFPNYGWCKKGIRLEFNQKANPIKYSLIMAISNKKVLCYDIVKGNINSSLFHRFLKEKLFKIIKNKYVLMDNVRFHKTKLVQDLFDESTNKFLFIPPYSPEFNCIENAFSIIKSAYRYECLQVNDEF